MTTTSFIERLASTTDDAGALARLLSTVMAFVKTYVVLTTEQALAVALWCAHTHVLSAFDYTPYLSISSATKRSGKSILLETLEVLVARPWLTGRTSAAALVRKVHAERPTLLLDESDAAFKGEPEYAEALRGILNSGFKVSGRVTLCVGQGASIKYHDFVTFGAKAIAGIGTLPDTIADRSIPIVLRRRLSTEHIERFRGRDVRVAAAPLEKQLTAWGRTAGTLLRDARPVLPDALNDRAADVWEPLLAIAELAGGTWPDRARKAAVALTGASEDEDVRMALLEDIRTLLDDHADLAGDDVSSTALQQALVALEDRPWPTWSKGRPLTPHKLARLLADFRVHPVPQRLGSKVIRVYRRDALHALFPRYLPKKAQQCNDPNNDGPEVVILDQQTIDTNTLPESEVSPITTGLRSTVALKKGGREQQGTAEGISEDDDGGF